MSAFVPSPQSGDERLLTQIFAYHYVHLLGEPVPSFSIQFYPYSNLRHTIRIRHGRIFVRLSDILTEAPPDVWSAILAILLHKLVGRKVPAKHRQIYREYRRREPVRNKIRSTRRLRGRKRLRGSSGETYDLQKVYNRLNSDYFAARLEVTHVSWSQRRNSRTLGHYDPTHDAIVISRRLDEPGIPEYVLEYVLYHEMLHALLGESFRRQRREVHHDRFRQAEQEFLDYDKARDFIHMHLR